MLSQLFGKDNGKSKKPGSPAIPSKNSTQSWLPIKDVHNHMIYRKDGYLVAVVMVSPVNIHLLSDHEKSRLIQSLEEVLSGVDVPFQILSIARPVDLDAYIAKLNHMKSEAPNPIKQRLLANYMKTAAQMATSGEALERHFYILLDQQPSKKPQIDEQSLMVRAKEMASNLSGAGLSAQLCSDEAIRDLLFIYTNPNQAAFERAPTASIQFPSISTVAYNQEG